MSGIYASDVSLELDAQLGAKGLGWFSPDHVHRYLLTRQVDMYGGRRLLVVGLNPSTADTNRDDATLRRVQAFALRDGYAHVWMANVYSLRSRDPAALRTHPTPNGPHNDAVLRYLADRADGVLCAWGADEVVLRRDLALMAALTRRPLLCLGTTKSGAPRHPLYLPHDTPMTRWERA